MTYIHNREPASPPPSLQPEAAGWVQTHHVTGLDLTTWSESYTVPELPEVETIAAALRISLVGRRLVTLRHCAESLRYPLDRSALSDAATGRKILEIRRRGKYLFVVLEGARGLLLHLGMSGSFRLSDTLCPQQHDHLIWELDAHTYWTYRDPRRFGMVRPISLQSDSPLPREIAVLGLEPLGSEFSGAVLMAAAGTSARPVKNVLLDQGVVAGLGNIYVNEALFRARVRPLTPAGRIARNRWDRIAAAVKEVLREALACGGTTLRDFTSLDGSEGHFALCLDAYGKEGQPCPRCGPSKTIRRIVQAGRSTFYCPSCQR